ncbi:hypothetical protein A2875_03095 [Candidatus Gottesmanbacteria bacterium RIFCSPHIGHO2_01_FULL_46_14]|uniref:Uncharacterized protein n=2 Tax=Candidatus Gottesmaniibacteriota TaxID=1752720 RepID=A0A1F5ZS35_9BACT|nr:MAG: hypothetical protein A2875_03095 [Candidatus Gottesmanbacteria bacterium RIFCSPHIGHO2_01_FULL_46_14]OGG30345.1 MAG: hypothetical protein A2971_01990 [Candidatus Gottesmanbacteria bacterium RIFCSPLOWO2_01_FULL_46_21]
MNAPVVLHLKVPRENDRGPVAAEAIFTGLSELFRHHPATLSFEIVVRGGFLYFFVVTERSNVDIVRGQLFSQYPTLEIVEVTDYTGSLSLSSHVIILKLERPDAYPIKTYKELETDFLSALSGMASSISGNDLIGIQVIVSPVNNESLSFKFREMLRTSWRQSMRKNSSMRELLQEKETEKLHKSLFSTTIRIAASADTKSELLASSVSALFKILDNPNLNSLKIWKRGSNPRAVDAFRQRTASPKPFLLGGDELATMYHLPLASSGIAQVSVAKSKTAEPPINLPTKPAIIPFATTNFRGVSTEFGIKREDRRKHLYIIGKTGVGKSKLIQLLALADIRQGKGCVIMDPHGDLSEEMLRYIPRERLYDVVYFNPSDIDYPMSFNPLEGVGTYEFKQTVVAGFIAIFKKLFSFTWNQRLEHVLRYTTLALLDVPGATVLGITNMLSDIRYRQEIIAKIQDPLVKKFWTTEFSSWNEQFAGEAITPIINKVGQFVANPIIRNIVGQTKSSVKLDEIINGEKILIANFAIGKLGEENSALLGAMFITKLWQAAVARASLAEEDRKDTYLYIDEFQNFATSAFSNILSEARKYRLNLTVAHQYMMQLPEEVRSTIFGNIGSIVSFRVGGEDAAVLEKEYTPTFSPKDFLNLDMRNFYVKMTIDGQTAPPFSGRTLNFPKPDEDLANDIVRTSRERFARPRSEVEKEIGLLEESGIPSVAEAKAQAFSEPLV